MSDWIQRKLGLKVNMAKTHITRPQKLKYLGFGFCKDSKEKKWKCRPRQDSVKKFKSRLKELTCRKMPGIVTGKIAKINRVTRGWINYYALGSMKTAMTETDAHLRTRLRAVIWKPVESAEEAAMGIAETGDRKRLCKSNGLLWKLLSMGSNQNLCSQGNLKGSACESGTWKLS